MVAGNYGKLQFHGGSSHLGRHTQQAPARQQRFVDEYLIDLNATQAAIRAGYTAKTAAHQASRLLVNVKVAEAVAAAQQRRAERTQIDADCVLRQWVEIASADPRELVELRWQPWWPLATRSAAQSRRGSLS